MENRDKTRIWGGTTGATLLAHLFQTLATFVECCRYAAGSEVMAKDLVELAWSFRAADIAHVRASVLFAIGTSFGQLRPETVLDLVLNNTSLAQHLPLLAQNDPDEQCRRLARLLVENVAQAGHSRGIEG